MHIVGVDFTSASRRAKPVTVAHGTLDSCKSDERAKQNAERRVARRYGLPLLMDPVEGWTAGAVHDALV